MKEIIKFENTNQTPIEIAMEVDKDGFTTAKKLYAWLELEDAHYSRWVKMNILDNPFAEEGSDYSPLMVSKKGRGQFAQDYRISASFAKKLAMSQHSARGEQARIYFLMCEKSLAQIAKEREKLLIERAKGIAVRKSLTDVIIQSGENERMKGHAIPTYTDMIYKSALGKNTRQLREERGLDKKDNLRDALSVDEMEKVTNAEHLVGDLLQMGCPFTEVKEIVMKQCNRELVA